MTTSNQFFRRPRLWGLLWALTLAVAQLFTGAGMGTAQAATTNCTPNGAMLECTVTFTYTGAPESWTTPAGVTEATFDLVGAEGQGYAGGRGGGVVATLAVTPGTIYQIRVGSKNGYNGGGKSNSSYNGGGGASDVRSGAFGLADRLLVAGGGGGSSYYDYGGMGGDPSSLGRGQDGKETTSDGKGGQGGGLDPSNCGGAPAGREATAGSLGQGGYGVRVKYTYAYGGGGGGGGYCGGDGGYDSPGGGGSSYGRHASFYRTPSSAGVKISYGVSLEATLPPLVIQLLSIQHQ